jgi:hypothetical protein
MSIVRKFGKPDLFLTVTCNPHWREITASFLHGQKPQDRPDIVARVFKQKLNAIIEDLKKIIFLVFLQHLFMLLNFKSEVFHMLIY